MSPLRRRKENTVKQLFVIALVTMLLLWLAPSVQADDVSGKDRMLCTLVEVSFCAPGVQCDQGPPWSWNLPDFIEIDLIDKELRTTKASAQNRKTPIRSITREDGDLILGGVEMGRSFVFSIREETGALTATVAAWGEGGVGFGTCTPLE
jgi:hypothetical protein